MSNAVARLASHYVLWIAELIIQSDESLSISIETIYWRVYTIKSIMVATLFVFGFMVNHRTLHFHLAGREVTLEVFHIGSSIPQAPLGKREELKRFCFVALVGQCQLLHFTPRLQWHKEKHTCLYPILLSGDARITHTMTAFIAIQWRFARLPPWRPNTFSIVDVEIASTIIHRHIVVTIACDSAEFGILIKTISSGCIRNQRKEIFVS